MEANRPSWLTAVERNDGNRTHGSGGSVILTGTWTEGDIFFDLFLADHKHHLVPKRSHVLMAMLLVAGGSPAASVKKRPGRNGTGLRARKQAPANTCYFRPLSELVRICQDLCAFVGF